MSAKPHVVIPVCVVQAFKQRVKVILNVSTHFPLLSRALRDVPQRYCVSKVESLRNMLACVSYSMTWSNSEPNRDQNIRLEKNRYEASCVGSTSTADEVTTWALDHGDVVEFTCNKKVRRKRINTYGIEKMSWDERRGMHTTMIPCIFHCGEHLCNQLAKTAAMLSSTAFHAPNTACPK